MKKENCFFLGKIIKKRGYKGELVIKLDTDEPRSYRKLESVFVELEGILVPFFFKSAALQKDCLRVVFEDVSPQQTDKLIGSGVFLSLDLLPELTDQRFYYHEIVGFKVVDIKYGEIGSIKQVQDYKNQAFFEIESKKKNVLIPVNDYFIERVYKPGRTLFVKTPEGLLDL